MKAFLKSRGIDIDKTRENRIKDIGKEAYEKHEEKLWDERVNYDSDGERINPKSVSISELKALGKKHKILKEKNKIIPLKKEIDEEEYSHPLIRKAPFELRYQKEGYKTLEAWKKSPKYKAEEKIKAPLKKFQRKQESLLYKADKASKEETYKKYMTEIFNLENNFFNNLEPHLFEEWNHLRITRPENARHAFLYKNKKPFQEPHKEKVKEINDYMKKFEHDMIKHKQYTNYLDSLKNLENMKSKI